MNHLVQCLHKGCPFKIVTSDPDRGKAGHRATTARASKHEHLSFLDEPHFPGMPTMPRQEAVNFGHTVLREILEADEDEARAENARRS